MKELRTIQLYYSLSSFLAIGTCNFVFRASEVRGRNFLPRKIRPGNPTFSGLKDFVEFRSERLPSHLYQICKATIKPMSDGSLLRQD